MPVFATRIAGVNVRRQLTPEEGDFDCQTHVTRSGVVGQPCVRMSGGARQFQTISGEAYFVCIDLRASSRTFGQWQSFSLDGQDDRMLSVPRGVAVGWQALSDDCEVQARRGQVDHSLGATARHWLRYDDPQLDIGWPMAPTRLLRQAKPAVSFSTLVRRLADHPLDAGEQAKEAGGRPLQRTAKTSRHCRPKPRYSHIDDQQWIATSKVSETAQVAPLSAPVETAKDDLSPIKNRSNVILVVGSSGQLGKDLCRHLRKVATVVGACREPAAGGVLPVPLKVDISRPASIREAIRTVRPQLVVNATGLTNVDAAEKSPRSAQLVNATAPCIMAEVAAEVGAGLIHFCSDKVFDGSGERPWKESDNPSPINQYGRTKLLGTQAVLASGVPHMVLRTGWLYSTHSDNFVRSLVDMITYRSSLTLPSDQFGSPTSTDWLAQLLAAQLDKAGADWTGWLQSHGGLYHVASRGYASRVEVGDQIVSLCRQHALPVVLSRFNAVPLSQLPAQVELPTNCRLDISKLALKFRLEVPRWQAQLASQIAVMLERPELSLLSVA